MEIIIYHTQISCLYHIVYSLYNTVVEDQVGGWHTLQ